MAKQGGRKRSIQTHQSTVTNDSPQMSPDGKQIVFYGTVNKGVHEPKNFKIYAVSRDGGNPERLIPDDTSP
jgi:Tol biopolymer transport system component